MLEGHRESKPSNWISNKKEVYAELEEFWNTLDSEHNHSLTQNAWESSLEDKKAMAVRMVTWWGEGILSIDILKKETL